MGEAAGERWRIGFLGPRGTFSEEAARLYAAGRPDAGRVELVAYRGIPELLVAAERGELDQAVVPAENSIEGTVALTLDTLVHDVRLNIVGEVVIPIRHHLMVRRGFEREPVQLVVSHPQALAQCRRYLQRRLPQAEVQAVYSTAEAARLAGEREAPGMAAIANALCAELYGLAIIDSDIQDVTGNATRFLVVGHGFPARTGRDKTSVAFAFAEDRPGSLYTALGEFARREINLTKLESRPAKQFLGDYIFFADMEGHKDDPAVADALAGLERQCAYVRILGSYPRAEYPRGAANG
ncbi:MAG TPA: prephenate dehydratase [Limnochordales bacterium]